MFSSFISREIGSALALYERDLFKYFQNNYLDKLELQFKRLNQARDDFLKSVKSNLQYLDILNNYMNSLRDQDATSLFYSQRDKALTELMNDKLNRVANKLWREMNRSEELIFDIRNSIYGGRVETKYHIGILVNDGDNHLLKSYELDPKQMLKLLSNRKVFKAEIETSKGIDDFNFSLRFTTLKGLTAENLIKAITNEGGQLYNATNMTDFLGTYSSIYSKLKDLNDISAILGNIDTIQSEIKLLTESRKGIGYKTQESQQKRSEIREELKVKRTKLNELLKSLNRAINFGYGRGFEAYERLQYGLEYMPTADNDLRYNDNTSWIMQQDVNFIDKTNLAKIMMIQNKFFAEQSRFSTISMSSLFSSLESFREYFSMQDLDYDLFYEMAEMDKRTGSRLDLDVYDFLSNEIVGHLQNNNSSSNNDDGDWEWNWE